ncbi:MAG: SGNH/GDSL hydrolase family protein [Planctomycetia bacterium]|nr:SGNH/GDSL hydrolase family protein [Planctomycetia bacterium]
MPRRNCLASVLIGLSFLFGAAPASAEFPLKDGDLWVMAGDSITAQHQHSNYFEAFCFARYPNLEFGFRNSGVGGHTIPTTLARFDYDIAGWKPTVVSVELGMNDQGGTPTDKFITNMKTMLERIRSIQARPVLLSASPVNDGTAPPTTKTQNKRLDEYALALKELAAEQKVPYADQFHPLVGLWAKNKPDEVLANTKPFLAAIVAEGKTDGVEHLRSFIDAQAKRSRQPISMQGDPVHPGPNGQLMMAAELLQALGAEGFVSSVVVDAGGKLVEAKGCQVDNLKLEDGKLNFERLDESLPFPIPDGTVDVLALNPTIEAMSRYLLQVKGLKAGSYTIKINGVPLGGSFTQEALEQGVNLTAPIHNVASAGEKPNALLAQTRAIYQAIGSKAGLVGRWRTLSKAAQDTGSAEHQATIADLAKQTLEADEKIRAAARPAKLKFEVVPAQ